MHQIQEKLLELATKENLGAMKLRDIAHQVGVEHPQTIKHHLGQLERKGLLLFNRSKKTVTRVNGQLEGGLFAIPILGSADCGPAMFFADENVEGYLKVSSAVIKPREKLFAIKAVGQSMNRASVNGKTIDDGDYVIVDGGDKDVASKDYVVSIIDDVCNIKKIYIDSADNQVTLISESTKDFPPIIIDLKETKYLINGKVVQVIKKPKI